jgi:RNA polymerase primary sigma factor
MPPLPRLRIAALDDLARQLRFAPAETLRRQMDRAIQLAAEIDPSINYPEDWVIFRITAFRPQIDAPATFVGDALLTDISAFIERLSAAAGLTETHLQAGAHLDAASLCQRWSISRKTLDRYRRMGLVALRITGAAGKPKLVFPIESIRRFEERHADRLAGAGGFHRLGEHLEARMVRRAGLYARAGLSLNQAAARIARRYNRGHETVRQLLQRSDGQSLFGERGPPSKRERRVIERSYWHWIEPADVARHLGRSRASIQRVMTDSRAERLRTLSLSLRDRHGDDGAILGDPAVCAGLGQSGPTDLRTLLHHAQHAPAPAAREEHARATAYQVLMALAAAEIATLPARGAKATMIDRIETRLRWAMRLKVVLIQSQLGQLARTYESSLGRPLQSIRAGLLQPLLMEGIAAMGDVVDSFEARKGGRLAAPVGMGLNRTIARFQREHAAELADQPTLRPRAAPHIATSVEVPDWTLSVAPWQRHGGRWWLEPDPRMRSGLSAIEPSEAALLRQRFGWDGSPRTRAELAKALETTTMMVAQRERRTARAAIAVGREGITS